MESPTIHNRVLLLPRGGGEEGEGDDAHAVRAEQWPACVAVADGATEAVYSGLWAQILANGIADECMVDPNSFADAVVEWQEAWRKQIPSEARDRPWYVEAKLKEGAFATALGLMVKQTGKWKAISVGDCCLFHLRNEAFKERWPTGDAETYDNRPRLLPSRFGCDVPLPETASGTWSTGDAFVLATDAAAEWLIRTDNVPSMSGWKAFEEEVIDARRTGTLRRDDVTLVFLELAETEKGSCGG